MDARTCFHSPVKFETIGRVVSRGMSHWSKCLNWQNPMSELCKSEAMSAKSDTDFADAIRCLRFTVSDFADILEPVGKPQHSSAIVCFCKNIKRSEVSLSHHISKSDSVL